MTTAAVQPLRWPVIAMLVVTAVIAAACSGPEAQPVASSTDVDVRPFSEIQDGPVAFEADPLDPDAGIFRVTTTEPAICAIVWGETEDLGRFNNSLAMNGTGIVQHDVGLPDLEPGREYLYVLQGTTADGTLYRSEIATFTIPTTTAAQDGDDGVDRGPNLALGATVASVSSQFNDAFAAANAIDGDPITEWSSTGEGDGAAITLDLGRQVDVTGVAFLTRSMADGSAITETFTITADGGEELGPFPAGSPATSRVADVAVTTRELTFRVASSTGGNVGAVEIQVFGSPAS